MFSKNNIIKLGINNRKTSGKFLNLWKLNCIFLKEKKKQLGQRNEKENNESNLNNENENKTSPICEMPLKQYLGGKQ